MPVLGVVLAVSLQTCFSQGDPKPAATNEPKSQLPPAVAPADSPKPEKKSLPPNLKLSAWASEIVKLARAGIDESVMLSFIENSGTFNLGADQIVYLTDLGIPSSVINTMLQHDREVIAGVRVLTISSDPGYVTVHEPQVAQAPNPPAKTEVAPQPTPAPSPAPVEKPIAPPISSFPNVTQMVQESPSSAPGFAKAEELPAIQPVAFSPARVTKKNPYPTRAPYSEELLPPIVVVKAYTPTPNVIIIERFPDAKP